MAQQKKVVTVTKIFPPTSRYDRQWAVSGSARSPYTVSLIQGATYDRSEWSCSCPAWTQNHPREDCKHVLRVKLQENAPAPAATMQTVPALAIATYTGRKMR